jgi:O-antigen ligase
MAPEIASPPRRVGVEALFVGLILLCVVGIDPFGGGSDRTGLDHARASGSALRQALHLMFFSGTLALALRHRVRLGTLLPPLWTLLFLAWCLISVSWALVPGVSVRRLALMAIVLLSVQAQVVLIGPERALTLLTRVLIGVLLINLVSIPLIEQARHLPGEDLGLDGDWRGVFLHKNQAGAVTAITTLLLLSRLRSSIWALPAALLLLSALFLLMTNSKTAIGLTLISAPVAVLFAVTRGSRLGRSLFLGVTIWAIGFALALIAHMSGPIADLFRDPTAFTGRMALWDSLWDLIRRDPVFGAGYGSFWNLGADSPISGLVHPDHWTARTGQGHNGYLDLLLTVGAPGLLLAVIAFLAPPLVAIGPLARVGSPLAPLLLGLLLLFAGANLMESFLAQGDTGFWVLFLTITLIGTRSAKLVAGVDRSAPKPRSSGAAHALHS